MRVHDVLPQPLSDEVLRAAARAETEEQLEVVFVGSARNAPAARISYPEAVLFRLWQAPADYAGRTSYGSVSASSKGGLLRDCYKLDGGIVDPRARAAWGAAPTGTVRRREVYDFVGLYRVKTWDDAMLSAAVSDPIREAAAVTYDEVRDDFVRGVKRKLAVSVDNARVARDARHAQVEISRTELAAAVKAEAEASAGLHGLELRYENQTRSLAAEFDLLAAHQRVADLGVSGDRLVITTTDDLRLRDNARSRWLGAFTVSIDLSGCGDIRIKNLSTRRNGADHPHIHDGQVCWGEYGAQITELAAKGELLTLFEMLVQFLETYNERDYNAKYAAWWMTAPDERPLAEATERGDV